MPTGKEYRKLFNILYSNLDHAIKSGKFASRVKHYEYKVWFRVTVCYYFGSGVLYLHIELFILQHFTVIVYAQHLTEVEDSYVPIFSHCL